MRPIGLSPRRPAAAFTGRSDLRGMVVRMISTNSLAAFTTEVSRMQGPAKARGPAAAAPGAPVAAPETPRRLDGMPPPPATPLPRGSLLDLKV